MALSRDQLWWGVPTLALALTMLLGWLDSVTGSELTFSLFYLIPVGVCVWYVGHRAGVLLAIACAATGLVADLNAQMLNQIVPYWNAAIRLGLFLVVVALIGRLHQALREARRLAETDDLTGATNRRHFSVKLKRAIHDAATRRVPMTLAYMDLDHFKALNDQHGHEEGDAVLRAVAACVRAQLRASDTFARLGGDEFALVLPHTDDEGARVAIERLHSALQEAMREGGWSITFSIGVLTCDAPDTTVSALVQQADALMYQVKRSSRDAIAYARCEVNRAP